MAPIRPTAWSTSISRPSRSRRDLWQPMASPRAMREHRWRRGGNGAAGNREATMPTVSANGIEINYEVTGAGEPIVLIPYLAADQACYAFQVAEYAKHYTCFTVDPRGAG